MDTRNRPILWSLMSRFGPAADLSPKPAHCACRTHNSHPHRSHNAPGETIAGNAHPAAVRRPDTSGGRRPQTELG